MTCLVLIEDPKDGFVAFIALRLAPPLIFGFGVAAEECTISLLSDELVDEGTLRKEHVS